MKIESEPEFSDSFEYAVDMHLSFIRGSEMSREHRTISANLYNKIHLLFSRDSAENLFVPIRSMQYLVAIDNEEIIFVDGQGPRAIEISWRDFEAGERESLHEPVSFTCIYYDKKGRETMNRLQSEFLKALEVMEDRLPKSDGATVIPLERH